LVTPGGVIDRVRGVTELFPDIQVLAGISLPPMAAIRGWLERALDLRSKGGIGPVQSAPRASSPVLALATDFPRLLT